LKPASKTKGSSQFEARAPQTMPRIPETEVLIVGGGPAGLAAAIAARQAGFEVMLADAARPLIDKACGEGIMPAGAAALARLGVSVPSRQAAPLSGIRFVFDRESESSGKNFSAAANFSTGCGAGIRRTTLHQRLLERAASLGVAMQWGTPVTELSHSQARLGGRAVRYRWLIGADGQYSRVRRWAGLDPARRPEFRFGFCRRFHVAPWSEYVDVHWSHAGQLFVTPLGPGEVCVAFLTRDRRLRLQDAFALFPQIARRLRNASSREQGGVTVMRTLPSLFRENCVLIGDASGSVDAITGEGLSLAFEQAHALASALKEGDLRSYQNAHREITRISRLTARFMLAMDGHPGFRRRALRALAAKPALFDSLLGLHGGTINLSQFGLRKTMSLLWEVGFGDWRWEILSRDP
jgi:flavin-dependent dehydrogenase